MGAICSISTTKTLERRRSGLFVVNFVHISHFYLVFLLLTLNKCQLVIESAVWLNPAFYINPSNYLAT